MHILDQLRESFAVFLHSEFSIDFALPAQLLTINVDGRRQGFGDFNSNISFILAKILKTTPSSIALTVKQRFSHAYIASVEVAGAGFLNITLKNEIFDQIMSAFKKEKENFFKAFASGKRKNISLEFVSANPTGPLHLGHGRGGIVGDVLCNVLRFCGHTVTKEFYINDAGKQIVTLGRSFKIRCQQLAGIEVLLDPDAYHGHYLLDLAAICIKEYGKQVLEKSDLFFQDYAKEHMLVDIKRTLKDYGITFDVWFSEKGLHDSGQIADVIENLKQRNCVYEQDGALWFASTKFGDDKDRVVQKTSGELTYIAADFAYLQNKIMRGYDELIIVLGHDHHSYATRLQGGLKALDLVNTPLFVILYQLVSIKEGQETVRMSKRANKMVTLADIVETVGRDIARFFYLNRKVDAQLEFDIDLALKKTDENPVFYIQYAFVRTNGILANVAGLEFVCEPQFSSSLMDDDERFLIKKIISIVPLLCDISEHHQTHLLAYYAYELAQAFNQYYHTHKVLDPANPVLSRHRMSLILMTNSSLKLILTLLGLSCPERM